MRKLLLLFACIMATGLQAKVITVNEAKLKIRHLAPAVELAYTAETRKSADLYIFNKTDRHGFVVVAADDVVGDCILGFSDEKNFDRNNIPDNLRWWLDEYQKQISWARENNINMTSSRKGDYSDEEVIVPPLLGNTLWAQGEPFNTLCPVGVPSGCVATAMAQIMYYHKWPLKGQGQHTNKNYRAQTVDFSQSVYDWGNMLDSYLGTYTEVQANAVAVLMRDCGCAVDMQYASGGSGAYDADVPGAMVSYFDYSQDIKLYWRDEVDLVGVQGWDDIITCELDARRPVYYSGQDTKEGGHAFVCDGYEYYLGATYFHFNFGWGGDGNGYFKSSAVKPRSYKFNTRQAIITGIHANNKVKSGNLYYNLLNDEKVSVTFPEDLSEYSGDIVIPSETSINGKTYKVISIGAYAFAECAGITSITIPESINKLSSNAFFGLPALRNVYVSWTEMNYERYDVFGEDVYSNAVLNVPDGTMDIYSYTIPWMLFNTISDDTKSLEYADRQPFETGIGNYHYKANPLISGIDKGLTVKSRAMKNDENIHQVIVENWGFGTPLVIMLNKADNTCRVPIQYIDFSDSKWGPVYITDIPSYYDEDTYEEYPCTYNPETGTFTLNVAYIVPEYVDEDGNSGYYVDIGVELLKMNGFKDFTLNVSGSDVKEQADGTGLVTFSVSSGSDIRSHRYAIFDYAMDDDEANAIARQMANGEVESKSQSLFPQYKVTLPAPGSYTFIAIGFDVDKEYQNYAYSVVDFGDTGIGDVTASHTADTVTHNLAGQQVGADYKGIVIQNGKKELKR